jgi:hypothetical protein
MVASITNVLQTPGPVHVSSHPEGAFPEGLLMQTGLSNNNFMPFDSDPIFATAYIPAELSCAGSWGQGFA